MKNEKGQVLILFVLILPVILLGSACIVDSSYMLYQKNRLDNINADVLKSLKREKNITRKEIEDLILLNDVEIVNDDISIAETITIDNHKMVNSIFGKLIGIDEYRVSSKKSIKYE